jgi:hypothetical protein
MSFGDLFVVRTQKVGVEKGTTVSAGARAHDVGIFITPKSLVTFPTASFAVSLLGLFWAKLFPGTAGSNWVAVVSAFFVGTVIFVATISTPGQRPREWSKWFVTIAVSLVNCIYLAATALGLLTVKRP